MSSGCVEDVPHLGAEERQLEDEPHLGMPQLGGILSRNQRLAPPSPTYCTVPGSRSKRQTTDAKRRLTKLSSSSRTPRHDSLMPWRRVRSTNCFPPAAQLLVANDTHWDLPLFACKSKCEQTTGCTAVVMQVFNRHEPHSHKCWLRGGHVRTSACQVDARFDVHLLHRGIGLPSHSEADAAPTAFAVCLVGELRSLIFPVVQARLNAAILQPLHADAYLVASRQWSRAANLPKHTPSRAPSARVRNPSAELVRPAYGETPAFVSRTNVTRIRAALPAIRAAIVAEDDELLNASSGLLVARGVAAALMETWHAHPYRATSAADEGGAGTDSQQRTDDTRVWPRRACAAAQRRGGHGAGVAWRRELCHTRLVHALRLRLCLELLERGETARRLPYSIVVRTRPDVWPQCELSPAAAHVPLGHAAFYCTPPGARRTAQQPRRRLMPCLAVRDYLAILSRAGASTALRELELSPSVPMCSYPLSIEKCAPCVLLRHGFTPVSLQNLFRIDVARQCQLLSQEKDYRTCVGFAGPVDAPPLDGTSCKPMDGRRVMIQHARCAQPTTVHDLAVEQPAASTRHEQQRASRRSRWWR